MTTYLQPLDHPSRTDPAWGPALSRDPHPAGAYPCTVSTMTWSPRGARPGLWSWLQAGPNGETRRHHADAT